MSPTAKAVNLVFAIALATAAFTPSAVLAKDWNFVVFSRPGEARHLDYLHSFLQQAAQGSQVYMSVYLNEGNLDGSIQEARKRGVTVNVNKEPIHRKNHNKFFLFSHLTDGLEDRHFIVVQSSGNVTNASKGKHQNTVIMQDKNLYDLFRKRFELIENDPEVSEYLTGYGDDPDNEKIYFYPKPDGGDTIKSALERVKPVSISDGGWIDILIPWWTKPRIGVAERLVQLKKDGYRVRVITRDSSEFVDPSVLDTLKTGGVEVAHLPDSEWIHSKYILINGNYDHGDQGGVAWRRIVFTGSPNLSKAGLRTSYETIMKIQHHNIFQDFVHNFETLWDLPRKQPQVISVDQ